MSGLCVWRVQTSVNAENPARKMSFEVVGEGSVTVTDVEDCIRTVQSGSEITVLDGMCIRVQSDAEEDTRISMKILDEELQIRAGRHFGDRGGRVTGVILQLWV